MQTPIIPMCKYDFATAQERVNFCKDKYLNAKAQLQYELAKQGKFKNWFDKLLYKLAKEPAWQGANNGTAI